MTLRHPLFVSGPSGGVASPQDARLALASLLTGPGILNGGTVTGSTSGPNMIYSVAAGSFVTARGVASTDGLYVVPNDGATTVDSGSPAPASGTRWDLIWVRCLNGFDGGFGDANSDPVFGVTVGTAGSSPTKPYSSVPAGALVLAESNVGTSIASASLATISMVAVSAVTAGGVLPASGNTQYPTAPYIGQYIDDPSLGLLRWSGSAWQSFGLGGDTGWVNVPLASGYAAYSSSNTPQYRVKNGVVYFQGWVKPSSGTFAQGTVTISGALPSAYWPADGYVIRTAATDSGVIQARLFIPASGGILEVGFNASGANYVDISALSYPLG